MSPVTKLSCYAVFAAALSACTSPQMQAQNSAVAQMSDCEKVKALIKTHKTDFSELKLNKYSTNRMDIWQARYHLVGDQCQIWQWGNGKTDYVCSLISPSEQIANDRYQQAVSSVESCLGSHWHANKTERKLGTGSKTLFSHSDSNTVVSTHVVKTQGVFKDEWTNYFFVGDRNNHL